jgi:hypothetical protein
MSRRVVHHYNTDDHIQKVQRTPVLQFLCINLCIILDSLLRKGSNGVEPHYLDVSVPMHRDDPLTPSFKVKTECIPLCMPESIFTHKAINSEINSIINVYYNVS